MGATRFLRVYTQEGVQNALEEGFSVGVIGEIKPKTDQVTISHEVKPVHDPPDNSKGKIIGYNINRIYPKD